ncbi:nucleoside-diphosphate sugar epimerase/dehydratase [Alteribacter natronophilus]|uniref:nucleoside-diphosphate sugar epimerase/dehydratase n=1 Tax=Alteribacter natronophilus TaxID=2583810 RepID=UPI00110ED90A|nr:nucleoside-diphosphate sugar epimerase/dehydratase [Alteribacter natronophilus]TMW70555.1 polysaccharide biosynthesis protein [Alteribacter natronophilus]
MAYKSRVSLLVLVDALLITGAVILSSLLLNQSVSSVLVISGFILIGCHFFFSYKYKLYKKAWEYASTGELMIILKTVSLSVLLTAVAQALITQTVHIRFLVVVWLLQLFAIGGTRFAWRMFRDSYLVNREEEKKRTLIVGAGAAGTMIARQLLNKSQSNLHPVAFVDDNPRLHNLDILGVPVAGGTEEIEKTVKQLNIENIVIAIPSLKKKELKHIFRECSKTPAKTQILPLIEDLVSGKVSISQFREVKVEDLLGREQVKLDIEGISKQLSGRVVLVTGAGGSIGSEICRQITRFKPEKLVLLGHGENSIYSIEMELKAHFGHHNIQYVTEIADIQDEEKIHQIMKVHKPSIVYHAAAHKHVPLMERNPEEAVKNNMIGTRNVALAAADHHVSSFVMISTDKAVNPTSVMGASKRLAEMIVQQMNLQSRTNFITVRFGNVLGSRGSVIPLFKKQIQNGGPVTVTHPDMVRYFMTIPEASRLVLQAGSLAKGGETFVLDMGDPVKIVDLAKNLIKLSGYSEDEVGITYTGMRPGEKLFEELLNDHEVHEEQIYPKIHIGKTSQVLIREIENLIVTYDRLSKNELRNELLSLANYKPEENGEPAGKEKEMVPVEV